MQRSIRSAALVLGLLTASQALSAQDIRDPQQNPLIAVRADRWNEARAVASRFADPVTQKLVLYYRLLTRGAATASEIADFMQTNPDWPSQPLLERRRQEAVAADPDNAAVLAQCDAARPTLAQALLRCAEALAIAGRTTDATATARQAWVTAISDLGTEQTFARRWDGLPTPDDQWARFERLAWTDTVAATRQTTRLDAPRRAAAELRLTMKRDDQQAEAALPGLSATLRDDPGLMLDRARMLRHTDRGADAVTLWRQQGEAAQHAAPQHLGEFWAERNLLARKLLRDNNPAGAYAVVADHGQTAPEAVTDAEFLAGFIALRRLNDPAAARRHFQALAATSKAAITQGRAHYWLARTAAAAGADPRAELTRSAAWATTFYGQIAAVALGDDPAALAGRISALHDPAWSRDAALAFTGHEVVRAAAWLTAWGDPARARAFLLRMDELAPVPSERTIAAEFALRIGVPDVAVFIARRVGRDGSALPQAGWPIPFDPPAVLDPAVSLGIMRQESSFDIAAVSSSGARGLMQLMPFTAKDVAKRIGANIPLGALTVDPAANMRLGTAYLRELLDRFGGALPLAVAGYNAGPHRVDQWLGDNGDPRTGPIDMIDWIELIPFNETRNYVQRVLENVVIYRARRGDTTPTLLAQWTR